MDCDMSVKFLTIIYFSVTPLLYYKESKQRFCDSSQLHREHKITGKVLVKYKIVWICVHCMPLQH